MDSPYRNSMAAKPLTAGRPSRDTDNNLARFLESANFLAHEGGQGLALIRNFITDTAMAKYPLTTLGMAFSLGVFAGWLVKRR
jgi:hypothetical protein